MQANDASIVAMATAHLRPGEAITSTAYVERQVPALIRSLRFIRFAYLESFHVAVTNERTLLFTTGGRLFGRGAGSPAAIEHAEVAKAEAVSVLAIGSTGMRLTLHNGLVLEFLVPKVLAGYEGQAAFVAGYIPWLAQGAAAQGFSARGPEFPRLPRLDMPPMLAHWALAVAAGLFALLQVTNVFTSLSYGHFTVAFVGLMMAAVGGVPAVFALNRIRTRAARLRGETPAPLLELAKMHRVKLAIAGAAVMALLVVGGLVTAVSGALHEREEADLQEDRDALLAASEAAAAERQAAAAARPAIDQWPPTNTPAEDPPLPAPPSVERVRAHFTGLGFTVTDGPPGDPLVVWTLVATGARGQTLTLTAESTAASQDASRAAGRVVAVAVRGPDPSVRDRILARLHGELMPQGEVLGRALSAGGVANPTVAGSAAHGTDANGNEYRVVARSLTSTDSYARGKYCVTSAAASVCVDTQVTESEYTLTPDWTFERIRSSWSSWAARVAAGVP